MHSDHTEDDVDEAAQELEKIVADARTRGVEVIYARIACLKEDGRDRSLSQKKPGFNYLLLPKGVKLSTAMKF